MPDRNFDSIEDLINTVKRDIAKTLATTVYENIKEVELEHVKSDVYDVYLERKYEWRSKDGIDDPDNIVIDGGGVKVAGNEIEMLVINEAYPVNGGSGYDYLDELLEFGTGIKTPYGKPRPFVKNTEKEIRKSNIVEKCLKEELDYIE